MRIYRVKCRTIAENKIMKHVEYLGIEKFKEYGVNLFNSYNNSENGTFGEIYEMDKKKSSKWHKISLEDALNEEL